jgi:hypothetical protein
MKRQRKKSFYAWRAVLTVYAMLSLSPLLLNWSTFAAEPISALPKTNDPAVATRSGLPLRKGVDARHHFEVIRSIMNIAHVNGLRLDLEQCDNALNMLGETFAGAHASFLNQSGRTLQTASLACDKIANKVCADYWSPDLGQACYAFDNE